MAGVAFKPRSAATCRSHQEQIAGPGPGTAFFHPDMERGNERSSVCSAYGYGIAGRAGRDGRHAVDHGHFWDGGLLGQQTAAGVGHSYRSRCAAHGSVAGSVGTRIQAAGFRLGSRPGPRNSGKPGARVHRLSGDASRSAGAGRRCSRDAACLVSLLRGFRRSARCRSIL